MNQGNITIIGGFEDDTQDCSLCSKAKEGIIVEEQDGTELFWCWACAKKLIRMRRAAKARQPVPAMNGS